jgi:ATP-binding protein involved in chromosome partitioning
MYDAPFLIELPLVQSISEAGDSGSPVVLQEDSIMSNAFINLAQMVAQQVAIQNNIKQTQ